MNRPFAPPALPYRLWPHLLLLVLFTPILSSAQDTKQDSLRYAMMMWEKTGDADMLALADSLRLCINAEQDDGSGVTFEVGDSDGLSVTPMYETEGTFKPGRGFTHVWQGRNDESPEPFDIIYVDVIEASNPWDGEGRGVGLGIDFPSITSTDIRIVVKLGEIVVRDTVITDPPPPDPPPGPFPLPEFPEIVWIDFDGGSVFPEFTWCEKTDAERAEENDLFDLFGPSSGGAPGRSGLMNEVLGFSYTLLDARDIWIEGAKNPSFGDRVTIVPQNQGNVPDHITGMTVMPRDLMEVTLFNPSVRKFGLEHFPNTQSAADMSLWKESLFVANIGSSGLDGIRTDLLDGAQSMLLDISPLNLRGGETLDWSVGGTVDKVRLDSMLAISTQQVGGRTFFQFDADPATGWTEFTLQFVRNGNVLRETNVPNGFRFGATGITLQDFGVASLATQNWEGFRAGIRRNGQNADIRLIPQNGAPMSGVLLGDFTLTASSPFGDMTVAYEEITVIWEESAQPLQGPRLRLATETRPAPEAAHAPRLLGHYPEPFNPVTTIRYALPEATPVRLEVFDLTGRRVALLAEGLQSPGEHTVRFDAGSLASGVYLYRLHAGSQVQTRSMLLMK